MKIMKGIEEIEISEEIVFNRTEFREAVSKFFGGGGRQTKKPTQKKENKLQVKGDEL